MVQRSRDVDTDPDQLGKLAMAGSAETNVAADDQPVIAIDIEALVPEEAFLTGKAFVLRRLELLE